MMPEQSPDSPPVPPKQKPQDLTKFLNSSRNSHKNNALRMACILQERLVQEAMKAKGTALSALCRSFDMLEERKRIMRNRPLPDAVLRFQKKVAPKASRDKSPIKVQPFPEPIDRSTTEPGANQVSIEPEPEPEPEDFSAKGGGEPSKDGKGIYFRGKG